MIGERHGTIAVFMGSRSYRGHEEREAGFRSVVVEDFQDLSISSVVEVAEDSARATLKRLASCAGREISSDFTASALERRASYRDCGRWSCVASLSSFATT